MIFRRTKKKNFNSAKFVLLGYFILMVIGTVLLLLPISRHYPLDFLTVLFTAVSAISVTGLVIVDIGDNFTIFGRGVILALVQVGALGFMSFTTGLFFFMRKKIALSQRLALTRDLSLHDVQGVVKLIKHVLIGTLMFQTIGILLLWTRFYPNHGLINGLGMAVFHGISAFTNAGFTIFGTAENYQNLRFYYNDNIVIFTIMLLAFIGGLGFFVWEDLMLKKFSFKKLHLHSKLVLTISFWLIIGSFALFFIAERNNPHTIGEMHLYRAAITSLFQVIAPRSMGFSIVNQNQLMGVTVMVMIVLMTIGASSGSTGGGVRNVTAGIFFLSAINYFKGNPRLAVFKRTIPNQQVIVALTVVVTFVTIAMAGATFIGLNQPDLPFAKVIFEVVSALGSAGLSMGITRELNPISQMVIIFFMFFGRVGIITLSAGMFFRSDIKVRHKHPETWVLLG